MEKKNLILTISAAVLIVLASFSSVVGLTSEQSSKQTKSPLFAIRTQRSIQASDEQTIQSQYLGKGITSQLFRSRQPSLDSTLDRVVKMLNTNPDFFAKILKTITSNPQMQSLLKKQGMTMDDFRTYLNQLKNDPSLFIDQIRRAEPKFSEQQLQSPVPLGLNTTNPFACVITAIVMIPVVLVIGLIVVLFTLRILQCLNLDEVLNNLMDQILQGLTPGEYLL